MDDLLQDLRFRLRYTSYRRGPFTLPSFRGMVVIRAFVHDRSEAQDVQTRAEHAGFFLKVPFALKASPSPRTVMVA